MINRNTSKVLGSALTLALSVSFVGEAFAQGAGHCMPVLGKLRPQAVSEGCTSAIGVCGTGAFTGLLRQLNFVATAITNTDLTPDTNVIVLTGNSVIDVRGGTLLSRDTVVLNTAPTGGAEFSEVDIIHGGTGDWEGATGVLQIVGTFPPTGVGDADYTGTVCTP